jgi:signal transduction histidine kinase
MKRIKGEYFKFLLVFLLVIAVLGLLNWFLTYFLLEKSAEIEFRNSYRIVSRLVSLYGQIINERMQDISAEILEIHRDIENELKKGRVADDEFLQAQKRALEKQLDIKVDIAIINRQGVIAKTTYAPEKNLDLNQFEDARCSLQQVLKSQEIKIDFPVLEAKGRFYRIYTLSYIPESSCYLQIGCRMNMLTGIPEIFSVPDEKQFSIKLYSVFLADKTWSVTCISGDSYRLPAEKEKAIITTIQSGKRTNVRSGESRFAVFKEILIGQKRGWNNHTDYHLVLGIGFDFGEQYFLVRLCWWINLLILGSILLAIIYGYRRLNVLLIKPLGAVYASLEKLKPVVPETVGDACVEIKTVADAYNANLENIKIRDFAKELIQAQEEERQRIARELHDSVAQDLSLALISLDMIGQQFPETKSFTSDLRSTLKCDLTEIRDMIFNLDSECISRLGLSAACEDCIEKYQMQAGIEIDFQNALPDDISLDLAAATNLYRILQEALSNTIKYSQADKITVRLDLQGEMVELNIEDNGIGFEVSTVRKTKDRKRHFGLTNMEERCRLLSGEFEVVSSPGKGCRVIARIPVSGALK